MLETVSHVGVYGIMRYTKGIQARKIKSQSERSPNDAHAIDFEQFSEFDVSCCLF